LWPASVCLGLHFICMRVLGVVRALQYKRFLIFAYSLPPLSAYSCRASSWLYIIMRRGYLQLTLLCPALHFSVLSSTTKLFVYSLVCIYYLHPRMLLLLFKRLCHSHTVSVSVSFSVSFSFSFSFSVCPQSENLSDFCLPLKTAATATGQLCDDVGIGIGNGFGNGT